MQILPQKQLKVVAAKPMSFHIGVPDKKEAAETASLINTSKKSTFQPFHNWAVLDLNQ
ncbi:MAG: hypothetical protein JRI80_17550 [Deltaproteobacteria bacterium]|nr:hypothetical protein [Deltaproteobacteria bacterium]